MTRPLRVATWNLHECVPMPGSGVADPEAAVRQVAELLTELEVDLVALQELDLAADGHSPSLRWLAASTDLVHQAVYPLSESSFFAGRSTGVALASRYPLERVERLPLPNPGLRTELAGRPIASHNKGLVVAEVAVAGQPLVAASLHAFPFHLFGRRADEPAFAGQWSALTGLLAPLAGAPLVVGGDFNTDRRDLVLAGLGGRLERALGDQPTYRRESADDVLHSQHLLAKQAGLRSNFSDHLLCHVEFHLGLEGPCP